MKQIPNLNEFKAKIKIWKLENCPCPLRNPVEISLFFFFFFFKLVFAPCKAEQPLRGMELQEKEAQIG